MSNIIVDIEKYITKINSTAYGEQCVKNAQREQEYLRLAYENPKEFILKYYSPINVINS